MKKFSSGLTSQTDVKPTCFDRLLLIPRTPKDTEVCNSAASIHMWNAVGGRLIYTSKFNISVILCLMLLECPVHMVNSQQNWPMLTNAFVGMLG